ncbi:MAG: ATP-binding protein, partial [Myxococcota bacterium]
VFSHIQNPDIISLIEKIKQRFQLNQREMICLGIIAQNRTILATEFARQIQSNDKHIKKWLGNLLKYRIILTRGKTKGVEYYVNPEFLKGTAFEKTDLSNIEEDRLKNLIIEDLQKYPNSNTESIHSRIGKEIPIRKIRRCIYSLVKEQKIKTLGGKKFRTYFIAP